MSKLFKHIFFLSIILIINQNISMEKKRNENQGWPEEIIPQAFAVKNKEGKFIDARKIRIKLTPDPTNPGSHKTISIYEGPILEDKSKRTP